MFGVAHFKWNSLYINGIAIHYKLHIRPDYLHKKNRVCAILIPYED